MHEMYRSYEISDSRETGKTIEANLAASNRVNISHYRCNEVNEIPTAPKNFLKLCGSNALKYKARERFLSNFSIAMSTANREQHIYNRT